jgi:DNA-binding NarL/FixJ family response regulator
MMQLISVVLVDDHPLVRETLRGILEDYGDVTVVGEASNGIDAVDAVDLLQPNIVVMDIHMPFMNGIVATACIKASHPYTSVIGLSVSMDRDIHGAMIGAGADVVIAKETAYEQLHSAIKLAVQGKRS